jgi:drug/metabolite transporter (DMT)-like permease
LLPLFAAACYAALHTFTRKIGATESALSMIFYIQLTFIAVSAAIGLAVGNGRFAGTGDPSLDFLLRAWVVPTGPDLAIITVVGVSTALAGFAIGQAYRLSEAALVAPFEYAAMPLSVLWGWLVFDELPDAISFAGIALILAAGLALVWREAAARRSTVSRPPAPR